MLNIKIYQILGKIALTVAVLENNKWETMKINEETPVLLALLLLSLFE